MSETMNKYLLLRDNKQTGPHSFEEMLELGFKKYDLVWVEGKSAAWRYPGESASLHRMRRWWRNNRLIDFTKDLLTSRLQVAGCRWQS